MHEKTVKRSTAVALGAGLLTTGLLVGTVGAVLLPRGEGTAPTGTAAAATPREPAAAPSPATSPSPTATPTAPAGPAPALPTSDRTSVTVDFGSHTVTCFGDVYWDWQVGSRIRGGDGDCRGWAVAMELDKDGASPEVLELLDQWPECADHGPYEEPAYETSGEAQWDWAVQQGVIDEDGNYLDAEGYPTGETVLDDE